MSEKAMKLPKQVQEQADLAEEFMAALKVPADESPAGDTDTSVAPAPAGDEPPATGDEPPATTSDTEGDDLTWQQRYNALQGKFNAEVPRLHQELKELKSSLIDKLLNPTPPATPAATEADPFEAEFEEHKLTFGSDLLTVVDKIAEHRARKILQSELKPVSERVDTVETARLEADRKDFADSVTSLVPEGTPWKEMMAEQFEDFNQFLDTKEPNGFFTYREMMDLANDRWDATKLAMVFNAFAKTAAPATPPAAKPAPKPNPVDTARVAPNRTTPASEPSADEPKMWTRAEIKQFEQDDRRGKYKKEESDALWKDLLKAPSENRVIG